MADPGRRPEDRDYSHAADQFWKGQLHDADARLDKGYQELLDELENPKDSDEDKSQDTADEKGEGEPDLAAKERAGAGEQPAYDERLYEPHESPKNHKKQGRFKGWLKKKSVWAALLITLVGGGGIIGTVTISQGPLEGIHLSQIETELHLDQNADENDDNTMRLIRLVRDPSNPQNSRMGQLSNRYANDIEARFNENGISSSYTKVFGYLDGWVVDPATLGGDFQEAQGKSEADVQKFFENEYDVTPETHADNAKIPEGKLFIPSDGSGLFQPKSSKFIRSVAKGSGYNKLAAYLVSRIMGKRAGIDWHPIKRVVNAIAKSLEQRFLEWRAEKQGEIQNGATSEEVTTTAQPENPKDQNQTASAESAANDTQSTSSEIQSASQGLASGDDSKFTSLEGTPLKVAGGGLNAVGMLCEAEAAATDFDRFKEATIILPRMRMAMMYVAEGYQLKDMSGIDLAQAGFFARQYFDTKTNTTWAQAPSIQQGLGQRVTGDPIPSSATINSEGNIITRILRGVPALGTVCKATSSPIGEAVSIGLIFSGGPVSAVVSTAVGAAIQAALPELLKALAGRPISLNFVSGQSLGSVVDYGAHDAANDIAVSNGGHPLSQQDVAKETALRTEQIKEDFGSKSLAYRLFNPYDAHTLVSTIIDKQSPNFGQNVSRTAASIINLVPNTFATLQQLVTHTTFADNPKFDYDTPTMGYTIGELTSQIVQNPYKNAATVMGQVLPGPDGPALITRARVCNGINIDPTAGAVTSTGIVPPVADILNPDNHCSDQNDNWTRVSNFIRSTEDWEALACNKGDSQSCIDLGFDNGVLNDQTAPQVTDLGGQGGQTNMFANIMGMMRSSL